MQQNECGKKEPHQRPPDGSEVLPISILTEHRNRTTLILQRCSQNRILPLRYNDWTSKNLMVALTYLSAGNDSSPRLYVVRCLTTSAASFTQHLLYNTAFTSKVVQIHRYYTQTISINFDSSLNTNGHYHISIPSHPKYFKMSDDWDTVTKIGSKVSSGARSVRPLSEEKAL